MDAVGRLGQIHRYPVKSMGGEPLDSVEARADEGLVGDRAFAILDEETGRVASAKHPSKWAALLDARARTTAEGVQIHLPDGASFLASASEASARLSSAFGRRCRIIDTPPRQARFDEIVGEAPNAKPQPLNVAGPADRFFDFAPIHLVTTATLAKLEALLPTGRFDVARFRPNLVVESAGEPGFVEHEWIGHELAIGDEVKLCVVSSCPRCVMTTLPQGELPADPRILRVAAQHNLQLFELLGRRLPSVGVYATVSRGGPIRTGDAVELLGRAPLRRAGTLLRAVKRAIVR